MIVLKRRDNGTPREVRLTDQELKVTERFDDLLYEGKGMYEALAIVASEATDAAALGEGEMISDAFAAWLVG